jgi:hypothetical protein
MATVAAHREEFEFDRHCSGANLDATPNDIIRRIERYSGVKLTEAFAIPDLDREIKWHCRYARQNGIHVSPTFMVDGLVRADMSSGDPVADWLSRVLKDRFNREAQRCSIAGLGSWRSRPLVSAAAR